MTRFVPAAWTAVTAVSYSCSSTLWNETWNAGVHHFIQPLSGLNSIDFVNCIFRKARDVEILSRAGCSPGRRKHSRAALHRRSEELAPDLLRNAQRGVVRGEKPGPMHGTGASPLRHLKSTVILRRSTVMALPPN